MFGHYYSNSQPIPKSPSNALVSRVSCSLLSIFLKMFLSVAFANSCNDILFLAGNQLYELQSNRRGWWGQKKPHCNFCPKQWLLSIDMKTKVVQHVESDWMRDWKSVRVRKSESEREWEWESVRVSFEHRHENKSCSEHSNIIHSRFPAFVWRSDIF